MARNYNYHVSSHQYRREYRSNRDHSALKVVAGLMALTALRVYASEPKSPAPALIYEQAGITVGGAQPKYVPATSPRSILPNSITSPPVPLGVSGNWNLKFDDEFNGSSLDTSKWTAMTTSMNNVQTYPSNVAVSGGDAILTLASSSSGAEICTCNNSGNYALPVGGYAEARVYFPGNGTSIFNWPAWWASGPNWPSAGENDIAEGLGTLTDNYHSPSGSHNQGTVPGVWSNAFHVYGIYRESGKVQIYYDGSLVRTYDTDDNGAGESLIVNVGSGNTAAYGTASQVKVDYVRAWQAE